MLSQVCMQLYNSVVADFSGWVYNGIECIFIVAVTVSTLDQMND